MEQQRKLVIATVVVAAMIALVAVFGREQRATTQIGADAGAWLPELQGALDDVAKLRLQSGAAVSTLVRSDAGWGVAEREGYPVDFTRLGGLLRELAEAKRLEQKTSKPEHFARLGLEGIEKPDSKAVLVEIWRGAEQPEWRVLIGNAAEGRGGRYVRLADANETWLIDRSPQAFAEPTDWIDRRLLGLDFERVARLQRELPGGGGFSAARAGKQQPSLAGEGIPAGKKPRYATIFDAAVRAVLNAEPEDVRRAAAAGFDAPEATPARNTITGFDGLVLEIDALKGKDGNWIRVQARAGEPLPEAAAPTDAGTPAAATDAGTPAEAQAEAGGEADASAPPLPEGGETAAAAAQPPAADATIESAPPAQQDPVKTLADEVAELNARLGGWAYKVSDYVYAELGKGLDEYIEEDKPEAEGDAGADAEADADADAEDHAAQPAADGHD